MKNLSSAWGEKQRTLARLDRTLGLALSLAISFALFRPPGSAVLLGFSEAEMTFSNTFVHREWLKKRKNRRNMQVFVIFTLKNRETNA
jgi:hypothetical protein